MPIVIGSRFFANKAAKQSEHSPYDLKSLLLNIIEYLECQCRSTLSLGSSKKGIPFYLFLQYVKIGSLP